MSGPLDQYVEEVSLVSSLLIRQGGIIGRQGLCIISPVVFKLEGSQASLMAMT